MNIPIFEECKTCLVQPCCKVICDEHKGYVYKTTNIFIPPDMDITMTEVKRILKLYTVLDKTP